MRTIFLTVVAALTVAAGYAQETLDEITVKDFTIELKDNGFLDIDIDIDLTQLDIKTTQAVILTPIIINDDITLELKSIAVFGRNRRIYYLRN